MKDKIRIDPDTGLTWEMAGSNSKMTQEEGFAYAKKLRAGGFSDWRLPTRKELLTLIDDTEYDPCIKFSEMRCNSSYYWSSTTYAGNTSYAWGVDFGYGGVYYYTKTYSYYVRCVRGGQ